MSSQFMEYFNKQARKSENKVKKRMAKEKKEREKARGLGSLAAQNQDYNKEMKRKKDREEKEALDEMRSGGKSVANTIEVQQLKTQKKLEKETKPYEEQAKKEMTGNK